MGSLTAAHLFAGVGSFSVGLGNSGIRSVWANELNEEACATFAFNHPKTRLIQKDIRELSVSGDALEPVDVLTGGFPCQPFSAAGKRQGFHDPRGNLFLEIIRLVTEFGPERPKVLLLENVPFLQYGEGGSWFARIRDEIQLAGYWFNDQNAKVLNTARITGIPQDRDRLFMVAFSADYFFSNRFKFPEPSSLPPLAADSMGSMTRVSSTSSSTSSRSDPWLS